MNELALFAGGGGGILGGKLLGWRTICAVEIDDYCRRVLMQRQDDGILEPFPIWDDVRTFDGRPWRGRVDVVSGGFPCQDISCAGKGAGIDGERSGLWGEMARIIREVQPRYAFVENSPMLTSRGLHRVLGDLAEMGFNARWGVLGADDVGAPHRRKRIWVVATNTSKRRRSTRREWTEQQGPEFIGNGAPCDVANSARVQQGREVERTERKRTRESCESVAVRCSDSISVNGERIKSEFIDQEERQESGERPSGPSRHGIAWWKSEPSVGRVADGVANKLDCNAINFKGFGK